MKQPEDRIEHVTRLVLDNWESIGVEEDTGGVLYLPATIKRRNAKGEIAEIGVMLRNITNQHRYRSRARARQWAIDLGLDLDRDHDLVDQLENYEILSFAIRDRKDDGYIQHAADGAALFNLYMRESLDEVWGRYDAWIRMLHPSFGTWDGEAMWQVIARIKGGANITPLAVMPGIEQASLILLMARAACTSTIAPSWLRSSGTSIPAL